MNAACLNLKPTSAPRGLRFILLMVPLPTAHNWIPILTQSSSTWETFSSHSKGSFCLVMCLAAKPSVSSQLMPWGEFLFFSTTHKKPGDWYCWGAAQASASSARSILVSAWLHILDNHVERQVIGAFLDGRLLSVFWFHSLEGGTPTEYLKVSNCELDRSFLR